MHLIAILRSVPALCFAVCFVVCRHAGLIHLALNCYIQWTIGAYLEHVWGSIVWFMIYFVSGVLASMFSACMMPDVIKVGASWRVVSCRVMACDVVCMQHVFILHQC